MDPFALLATIGYYLAIVALFILPVLAYGYHWRARWQLRHIPGPKPSFLMGNWEFVLPDHVIRASREWPKHYGPVMKYFQGKQVHVLCTDPDLVHEISVKQFTTFPDRRVPFWMCGLNKEDRERPLWEIFFARGKRWSAIRKAADPLFHANAMKAYMPIFKLAVSRFLSKLEKVKPGESIEIVHPMKDLGLEVIGATVFGVDFQTQGDERIPLAHSTGYLSTPEHNSPMFTMLLLTFPSLKYIFGWFIGNFLMHVPLFNCFATNAGYVDGASKVLIKNSRKARGLDPLQGQPPSTETYESANAFRKTQLRAEARAADDLKDRVPDENCLFTKLQTAELKDDGNRRLTDAEIAYQGTIFVTAGHETSALTMAYAMFELAQKPHYQDIIRNEVRDFEKTVEPGHEFTYNDLKYFRYARACIEETMRKHPPVNCHLGSIRVAAKDATLGGFRIPKGTPVVCNSFGMVRDPKIFPNPDEFLPERFLDESDIGPKTWNQYAHIPFGAGPHKCIGARFAVDEAALAIASFIRKYKYSLDPEKHPADSKLQFHCGLTVIPKGGVWIKLDPVQD